MKREKNTLELDGDDSTDEETTDAAVRNYDTIKKFNEFSTTKLPSYLKEHDPESYSFLVYSLAVKKLYSRAVNAIYYEKNVRWGK